MVKDVATLLGRPLGLAALCVVSLGAVAPAHAQDTIDNSIRDSAVRNALGVDDVEDTGPASLEADEIIYDAEAQVVRARGDVQVFHGDRVLRADEIIYDAKNDRVSAKGDIRIINPDGSVMAADDATFDTELKNGLIRGAKAVLSDGQTRLAAVEGRRVDDKYTTLSKAVFSPCKVCEDDPTPLWRIRARRVVQDEEAHDIIYEDATFEVMGVPVGYLPYFRHADPSVKRRTGFLSPEIVSSGTIGDFVKTPYFWNIDPNRDLTVTPFIGFGDVFPSGSLEYRAWESLGKYRLGGSLAYNDSDESADELRGHFDGEGEFYLDNDIEVGFEALLASDDTYLRRYEFTSIDRTQSRLYAQRFTDTGFTSLEAVHYQSFRSDEPAGQIPEVLPHLEFEEVFDAPWLIGNVALSGDALYLERSGFEGRDTARLSSTLAWNGNYVTPQGVVLDATASVRGDLYHVNDDDVVGEGIEGRVLPLAALTTSFPLAKQTEDASHVIEPVASLVYAPYGGNPEGIPNEDSQDVELDELSIFDFNRFVGLDRWEDGPRATIGMRYRRLPVTGPAFDAEIGQTYRLKDSTTFSDGSGLRDATSDIVGAWNVSFEDLVSVGHRFRLDDSLDFDRNEVYASARLFDRVRFSGTYVSLSGDPEAGDRAEEDRQEAKMSAAIDLTQYWTVRGSARHDIENERFVNAGGGLSYADECFEVDLSVSRRFNSVNDAPATTTYGLAVRLKSLGVE